MQDNQAKLYELHRKLFSYGTGEATPHTLLMRKVFILKPRIAVLSKLREDTQASRARIAILLKHCLFEKTKTLLLYYPASNRPACWVYIHKHHYPK